MEYRWRHPDLGWFTYDYVGWARDISLPAFKPFRYAWGGQLKRRSKFKLSFYTEDKGDDQRPEDPTAKQLAISERVVANQSLLFKRLVNAVWRDMHGRGPETGMWWHGDKATILESVGREFSRAMPFEKPEDLFDLMGLSRISVFDSAHRDGPACAILNFDSAIDCEHGIGVLSDGWRILGVGYQVDVQPYKK